MQLDQVFARNALLRTQVHAHLQQCFGARADLERRVKELVWHLRSKINHKALLFATEAYAESAQTIADVAAMMPIWQQLSSTLEQYSHEYIRKHAFRAKA